MMVMMMMMMMMMMTPPQPPRVGGVKVYIDNVNRNEIVMDIELRW